MLQLAASGVRLVLAWGWLSLANVAWGQDALPPAVNQSLAEARLSPETFGALVIPLSGKNATLAHRADVPMAPASTLKLLTTAVALDELGPTYRWRTQLLTTQASASKGTLRGPLFLRGGGDPNLSWQQLQMLLRELRSQGIRHLQGDVVLDRSHFLPERPDVGLPPFDESPDAYYNVIPDALLVHSNLLTVRLQADPQHVQWQLLTPLAGVQVHSNLTLNDLPCSDWDEHWQAPAVRVDWRHTVHITLQGSFPRNCTVDAQTNVLDRNLFIERLWRALWRELGGTWSGRTRDGHTPPQARVLAERSSDTLADVVKVVNKRSDNAMARTLLLTLGAEHPDRLAYADHLRAGQARITQWLVAHGIDPQGAVLDNGSGLSRLERLTARQLAQVIQVSARGVWYPELAVGLPVVGIDGAMRRRLVNSAARAQSRIKTGSLRDTAAIAGTVRDPQGHTCVVVALVNDPQARRGRAALDALIDWVANTSQTCVTMSP